MQSLFYDRLVLLFFPKSKSQLVVISFFLLATINVFAEQTSASPQTGDPLPGLTPQELSFFNAGKEAFLEIDSVTGTEPGASDAGLGPRFNLNSCVGCHAQPAPGGSSPAINPQIAVATRFGATNKIPSFITLKGPVREARFKFNPDGSRDGSVHALFVISGRADSQGCFISQPDFDSAVAANNVIFRIPTPVFGSGLIEAIPDEAILANKVAFANLRKPLGIHGRENRMQTLLGNGVTNRTGNDGTITRFGWKAQNKSLMIFSGEAYNVEQGVTNELFQNERDNTTACHFNPLPEDFTHFDATTPTEVVSDVTAFSIFMRFLAPPPPKPATASSKRGSTIFKTIGCSLCHTPTLMTGPSNVAALHNQPVNLYSDLLVHSMGPGLADSIIQGYAGPDDFRTAPLWGLSDRLFFLHDGRTSDLNTAINAHASSNPNCGPQQDTTPDGIHCQSEANGVIGLYSKLSAAQKTDLLAFLKTL